MDLTKKYKKLQKEIDKARIKRVNENPFAVHTLSMLPHTDYLAKLVVNQQHFVDTEVLTMHLLEFYAFNPVDFATIVGHEIRKKLEKKDEFYYNECEIAEISDLIVNEKVYKHETGIFTAWSLTRTKYGKLTYKEALQTCLDMQKGGI
jgi:hypothetical protein